MAQVLSVETYKAKESIPLYFAPTEDGVALSFSTYGANAALDGTLGNLKCQVSVFDSTGAVASTFDGLSMSAVTMFKHPTETNSAVFTARKGFNPTADTTYTAIMWYDSTGAGSGGVRVKGTVQFKVKADPNTDSPPFT